MALSITEANPEFDSFVADMKRPLSIKVEIADGNQGAIYKTVFDAEEFFHTREPAREQLTGEQFLQFVYYEAKLCDYEESHQLTYDAFKQIAVRTYKNAYIFH